MKIGLIIAIERELEAFINKGINITKEVVHNRTIYSCEINGHQVYAIKSGYGEIDASSGTELLIVKYDVDLVVNFGVTGALTTDLKVSDLFVVEKVCHYHFDVSAVDPVKKHQYMEFGDEFMPLDKDLIAFVKSIYPDIKPAIVASGDKFINDKDEKIELRELGCNICEMEIAAIARTCHISGVRCLSIKCISDTFDGDGGDFIVNVTASAEKAFDVLLEVLRRL